MKIILRTYFMVAVAVSLATAIATSCKDAAEPRLSAAEILESAGPVMPAGDFGMEIIETEDRGTHTCSLVEFNGENGDRIRAYLLLPASAEEKKCPAILMLHDHGARFDIGKEKLAKPLSSSAENIIISSQQWANKYFDSEYFADLFAAEGYVVLVPDALYWGERSCTKAQEWSALSYSGTAPDKATKARLKELKQAVFNGQRGVHDSLIAERELSFAGKILYDDMAAARLLASMPSVDSGRIGCFGFSMGAHRTWLLAAVCDKISCGAAICWMTTIEGYSDSSPSDLSMRIAPLREKYDFSDIAYALYPKPMLFINGRTDKLFPAENADSAFVRMHRIYDRLAEDKGKPSLLETGFQDEGHHCGMNIYRQTLKFFQTRL